LKYQNEVENMKNIIFTIAAFLLFASAAFAQGSIAGKITDAKGNGVAGLKVTLFGADGKSVTSVTTGADGAYSIDKIAAGTYKLAAFNIDYQEPVIRSISVEDDDTATVNIVMGAKRVTPTPVIASKPPLPKGYIPAMTALLAEMNGFTGLKPSQAYLDISAQFATLGDEQKTEWLPYYYAAFAVANYGWMLHSDQDANADKGNAILEKAEALSKGNSEIYIVRAMFAQQQMMVAPYVRWQTFGMQASEALETAKKLNPNNPRVYYMLGMAVFGAPEPFGGGKAKAKPYFEEAVKKFDAFKPESSLSPNWGRQQTLSMLDQISH
jgi:hypothetical protein